MFPAGAPGPEYVDPLLANTLRSNGAKAWFGWPDDPKLEAAYEAWIDAPNEAERHKYEADFQSAAFTSVPTIPLGPIPAAGGVAVECDRVAEGFRAGVLGCGQGMSCEAPPPAAIVRRCRQGDMPA